MASGQASADARIAWLRSELAETEDELRQLQGISNEMWEAQRFPMTWADAESLARGRRTGRNKEGCRG
ncbi:hypothetical protein P0W64_21220 [Tsukamurella sp. 8F]|uniref:hypothetical protein n=1 Tax=unclassified Tsukamurella TaxID=2633480 RepID=UPI0023B94CD8|nr:MULTISPECIES: hypothetical protein [unclassified Tsukamurella]MDF0532279.1 hypothetical protein [Tsukamurella sp. 8J]MDF0589305.1 hypothetical protein [Tsukamurella sp. 8F]